MKISARNVLKGKVLEIKEGTVNAEVTLEVAPNVKIVSMITKESIQNLGLKKGSDAFAIIKASSVMMGVDH
ncbi:MAG: TOBE domain-containing protein [Candidatus Riflebacteria bacterium]|nr:TOBE domain-containing protein [Candidatus Riflebacteria bacterium]